mgnify:FL=1
MVKHSIACIAFCNKKVLIAHRNPVGQMGGRWEFPGGKVEEGESYQNAIEREFEEEFGTKVKVFDLITEKKFVHSGTDFILHAYRIEPARTGEKEKYVLTEHTGYVWTSLDSIRGLNFVDSDLLIYPDVVSYAKKNGLC